MFISPDEGFPWDDLREILPGCQQMANVPNGIETLPKISIAWVGRTNVTDRRQTDGRTTTYSERERLRSLISQSAAFFPRCMECQRGLATKKCLSVCPFVGQTRAFWIKGRKICPDGPLPRIIPRMSAERDSPWSACSKMLTGNVC